MTATSPRPASSQLVFVPLRSTDASDVVHAGELEGPVPAVMVTPELCETFDVVPDTEEAELAALQVAAVWSLIRGDRRLVGVFSVEEPVSPYPQEQGNGAVQLATVRRAQMQAFFSGEDAGSEAALAARLSDLDIDEAWALPEVSQLAGQIPLQWHDASELSAYLSAMEN